MADILPAPQLLRSLRFLLFEIPPCALTPLYRIYALALSRDGKTAAVARGRNLSDVVLLTQTAK